jgi:hypothetical protein
MSTTYNAYVTSDLYDAGRDCDGHPFIAEQYYVLIENERGTRFRHVATWNGTQRLVCDETGDPCFPDLREEARGKALRLADRVNAALNNGTGVDWAYWYEVDPVYGSDEYIAQGTEAQRAMAERMEG